MRDRTPEQIEIEQLRDSYENLHRVICDAAGYIHDERDWRRDEASLAGHVREMRAAIEALRKNAALLAELLFEARLSWIKVGYGASREDVAECKDFCNRIDAAMREQAMQVLDDPQAHGFSLPPGHGEHEPLI